MTGMESHSIRQQGNILDIANPTYGSSSARGAVHAAGIQFDHAFFVGMSSQADAFIIGVILRSLHDLERSIECVPAAGEKRIRLIEIVISVARRNDDWQLGRVFCRVLTSSGFLRTRTRQTSSNRSG